MRAFSAIAMLCATTALAGCLGGGGPDVARSVPAQEIAAIGPRAPALDATQANGETSAMIAGLIGRGSALQPGPMAEVASAVLAANSRAAEAELRAARLRDAAKTNNWLPRLGPSVNLTSLSGMVTSLVLNQAILDNGARAAERDYARADVEVAAVALAEDSNQRVHEALGLYLAAEAATARAGAITRAQDRLDRYVWMVEERVSAGVSDRGDLQVVTQRRDALAAELAADREAAAVARAELQAMSATPIDGLSGLSGVGAPPSGLSALTVLRAQAEGARAVAESQVIRAGYLPGLSLGGDLGASGGVGLTVGAQNGLGMGQGAAIEAAMAEAAAVEAQVSRAEESATREVAALQGRLESLQRQVGDARSLAAQAEQNFILYSEQQRAGQRSVSETVSVLETWIRAERTAIGLDYDVVATRLAVAARIGVLVEGDRM